MSTRNNITNNTNDLFELDKDSTTLKDSLQGNSSGDIAGTFTPTKPGFYQVTARLTFKEGQAAEVTTTQTQAVKVTVVGENTKGLPAKMGLNTTAEVIYTFTNPSDNLLDATGINLTVQDLDSIKITRKKPDDSEEETTVEINALQGAGILDANEVLTVSGTFTASDLGENKGPVVSFEYKEGDTIEFTNTTQGNTTEVEAVRVKAEVTKDLPSTMKIKEKQKVQFTFTNQNTDIPASDLKLTISAAGSSS